MAKTYTMQFGSGDPRTFTGLAPTFLIFVNASSGATIAAPAISEALAGSGLYKFAWGTTTPIAFLADAFTTSPGTVGRYVTGQIDPADRSDEYGTTMIAIGTTLLGYGASTVAFGLTLFGQGSTNLGFGATNFALNTLNFAQGVSMIALGTTTVALGTTGVALGVTGLAVDNLILAQGVTNFAVGISLYALIGTSADSFGTTAVDPSTLFGFLKRNQEFWEGNQTYAKATGLFDFYNRGSSTLLREKTISDSSSSTTKS